MEAPATKTPPSSPPVILHRPPSRWPVILIGMDKLVKAALLVAASFFVDEVRANHPRPLWLDFLEHRTLLHDLFVKLLAIPQATIHTFHLVAIVGVGLYLIEGAGLLFDQKWAEWIVVIGTAGFIPVEIYEICRDINWVRCTILVINLIVLAYLCFRLHRQSQVKREREVLTELIARGPASDKPAAIAATASSAPQAGKDN